jgi:hypothetical protein
MRDDVLCSPRIELKIRFPTGSMGSTPIVRTKRTGLLPSVTQ